MQDAIELFPGDSPLLEGSLWLLTFAAIAILAMCLGATLVGKARLTKWRVLPLLVVFGLDGIFLVHRHIGPWRALQLRLIAFEEVALRVRTACKQDHRSTVDFLDNEYGTSQFWFSPEHEPVRLFLRPLERNFVAVDFGHGATAVFNHTWMYTVYSD